jgi:hypothetical protein
MGAFLLVCIIGVLMLMVLGSVVGVLGHALFWIITLPFRILFKLVFGLGSLVLGLRFAPVVAVVAAIGLVVALLAAVLSLLTPLLPLLLLGGFGWAIYRAGWTRHVPPPPPPAFWS